MPPPTAKELRQQLLNKKPATVFKDSAPDVRGSLKKISLFATKTVKVPIKKIVCPSLPFEEVATL
jgi:ribosomal protein L30/L7E